MDLSDSLPSGEQATVEVRTEGSRIGRVLGSLRVELEAGGVIVDHHEVPDWSTPMSVLFLAEASTERRVVRVHLHPRNPMDVRLRISSRAAPDLRIPRQPFALQDMTVLRQHDKGGE